MIPRAEFAEWNNSLNFKKQSGKKYPLLHTTFGMQQGVVFHLPPLFELLLPTYFDKILGSGET
jgi:hypothetical protein